MSSGAADPLVRSALAVRDLLVARGARLVTAESCTAGKVVSTLAEIPGASDWLCGGFVVYRSESKRQWLDVPSEILESPHLGPVSQAASNLLARNCLRKTPEATLAFAVTGDIGPNAPPETDGHLFMAIATPAGLVESAVELSAPAPRDPADIAGRQERMREATELCLRFLQQCLLRTSST